MKKFIVMVMVLCCTFGFSADWWEKVRVNGFFSQAYMKSSDNNFLAESMDGTFEVNELGLTISTQLNDKLRFGMQFLSRDLGDIGNNKVVLDWAFADYHYSDYLGFRIGKVKLPFGLYNEARDTDFLRSTAFLPQGLYDETKRGFMVSYQGLGIYGNLPLSAAGDLDYHIYTGTTNADSDEIAFRYFTYGWNTVYSLGYQPALAMMGFTEDLSLTAVIPKINSMYGGQVIWNTFIDGLRLGFSYYSVDAELKHPTTKSFLGDFDVPSWYVISFEYSIGNFILSSEYAEMEAKIGIYEYLNAQLPIPIIQPLLDLTTQTWYVMASYQLTDKLAVTAMYDEYYTDKDDKEGAYYVSHGQPAHLAWRKDTSLTLRYDVTFNWTLKAEWHDVDGSALFMVVLNPEGAEQNWSYGIIKASFSF